MPTQRYSVAPHPIDTLLTWVKSGEIAIPEIQRPFVWDATAEQPPHGLSTRVDACRPGPTYDGFLEEHRQLTAQKIKAWFEALRNDP